MDTTTEEIERNQFTTLPVKGLSYRPLHCLWIVAVIPSAQSSFGPYINTKHFVYRTGHFSRQHNVHPWKGSSQACHFSLTFQVRSNCAEGNKVTLVHEKNKQRMYLQTKALRFIYNGNEYLKYPDFSATFVASSALHYITLKASLNKELACHFLNWAESHVFKTYH